MLNLVQVGQNLHPQGLTLFFENFELGAQLALLLHALAQHIDIGRNGLPALGELVLHRLSELVKQLRDQGVIVRTGAAGALLMGKVATLLGGRSLRLRWSLVWGLMRTLGHPARCMEVLVCIGSTRLNTQ